MNAEVETLKSDKTDTTAPVQNAVKPTNPAAVRKAIALGKDMRKVPDTSKADVARKMFETIQDLKERLPILQLLSGPENQAKQDTMPEHWIASTYPIPNDRHDYVDRHALVGVTADLGGFEAFYAKRRTRSERAHEPVPASAAVAASGDPCGFGRSTLNGAVARTGRPADCPLSTYPSSSSPSRAS